MKKMENKKSFEIIFDKDGTQAIEWGAFGVPESFLIFNQKIIKKYIGPLNNELIKEIKLIGKKPTNIAFGGKDLKQVFVTMQDDGSVETFTNDVAGFIPCLK